MLGVACVHEFAHKAWPLLCAGSLTSTVLPAGPQANAGCHYPGAWLYILNADSFACWNCLVSREFDVARSLSLILVHVSSSIIILLDDGTIDDERCYALLQPAVKSALIRS